MNKFEKKSLFIPIVITILISVNTIVAAEIYSRGPDHRGVIELLPYQIYPENRVGNGI